MEKFIKLFSVILVILFTACGKKDVIVPTPTPLAPTPITIATITTMAANNVNDVLASSGGNITNNGGAAITESGICYATTANPSITNTIVSNSGGGNSFVSILTGLNPSTFYYVRAYAKNSIGIGYGNEVTFTTLAPAATLATVTTNDVVINSNTSATFSGSVVNNGGATITSTSLVISWNNEVTGTATQSVTGTTFTKVDCIPGTIYTVKFQATNSAGTATGMNKTGATTGYHVGQDLGYAIVYKTVNNTNNCYFASKVNLFSGVGNTTIAAGIAWQLYLNGSFTLCNALSSTNGKDNTLLIVNSISSGSVARVAHEYTANGLVLSNTFWCPAKDEMVELLQVIQTINIPNFSNTFNGDPTWGRYWSSTEFNKDLAYWATRSGTSGVSFNHDAKQTGGAVRPIGYK